MSSLKKKWQGKQERFRRNRSAPCILQLKRGNPLSYNTNTHTEKKADTPPFFHMKIVLHGASNGRANSALAKGSKPERRLRLAKGSKPERRLRLARSCRFNQPWAACVPYISPDILLRWQFPDLSSIGQSTFPHSGYARAHTCSQSHPPALLESGG